MKSAYRFYKNDGCDHLAQLQIEILFPSTVYSSDQIYPHFFRHLHRGHNMEESEA